MTPPAPREHRCSFCNRTVAEMGEHERLVYSTIGGWPPPICSTCAEVVREWDKLVAKRHEDAPT
jgi:hypothetical protein